ncbi:MULTISPECIES: hypothetical protein [Asanoa]|uniref:ATP/GTP-binding protein n=2 Tax=Asanoa TaxID=195964 RepID=A0A239PFV7_9ACTN|nr:MULTISPECIES: hypothetical protein [Asanoa]GIF74200.1 hypothetical protein Asi02nite_37180 [Asanoa siamensis]SNT65715.1 hypothetical protein SAMN05421812_12558 [Asanoa hainanensis]
MLTRRIGAVASAVIATAAFALVSAGPAYADYYQCTPDGEYCWLVVETPGGPGEGGGGDDGDPSGGSTNTCEWQGQWVSCFQEGFGWFNESDGCYYILESPQPAAGDPVWEGHAPGDGAIYRQRCFGDFLGTPVWRQSPPPGQPGSITPAQLAARAIRALPMGKPQISVAPQSTGRGLVGLPVWMWTAQTPTSWGPVSRTAAVPGLAVTARAEVTRVVWAMGDGGSVTCTTPGTAYRPAFGGAPSPDCGYRYERPTPPGGLFTVTATATWTIQWWVVGGGERGDATATRLSQTTVQIDELQVVTR